MSPALNVCTVVARNYVAHARVLAESVVGVGGRVWVLVLDDADGVVDGGGLFEVVRPGEVFGEGEFAELVMMYSVLELATAVKPRLLRWLVEERGCGEVVYLDPDIRVFEPLDDVVGLAVERGIVLTPHTTVPVPRDGRQPSETFILQSGVYNLGFIAVSGEAKPFLEWWWERLRRDCVVAPERGVFVDQRWIDFVPGYFDHALLRDPGANVAYWNLGSRVVEWTGERYVVNGEPLRFFHFSGFDPDRPYLLSKHQGERPRVLLSEHPGLLRICGEYAEALRSHGYEEAKRVPYGLGRLGSGMVVDRWMRVCYREALVAAEDGEGPPPPPEPWRDEAGFVAWLNEPADPEWPAQVTRYLGALWAGRADLRRVFPDLGGGDGERFLDWVRGWGWREEHIPEALQPGPPPPPPPVAAAAAAPPRPGVNVAGYLRAELGVGEAARQLVATLEAAGVDHAAYTYTNTRSRQGHAFAAGAATPAAAPYDINVVCVNADQFPVFAADAGPGFFRDRYTVGMWAWETETFPTEWADSFDLVDEIWMNSHHAARAVARHSPKPVHAFPLAVAVPDVPPHVTRADLGLPDDRFVFLFSFDFYSVFARKNPLGLVDAFTRAFPPDAHPPGHGPLLVIKSINGDQRLDQLEQLRLAAAHHPDIRIIDGYLPPDHKNALMATCDAYVSLHRAEGFGITMAEAMALAKPTIATGYSGNLDFMNPDNAYLVDYTLTPIGPDHHPYLPHDQWAEPDLDHAAHLLHHVHTHPDQAHHKGQTAHHHITTHHTPQARTTQLTDHLTRIRTHLNQRPVPAEPAPPPGPPAEPLGEARAAIGKARAAVTAPRANQWPGTGSRAVSRAPRALLGRLVQPLVQQEQLATEAVLDAVDAVAEAVDAVAETVDSVADSIAHHQGDVAEWKRGVEDIAGRLESLAESRKADAAAVEQFRAATGNELSRLHEALGAAQGDRAHVEATIARLVADVGHFQGSAVDRFEAIEATLRRLDTLTKRTASDLRAVPYMTDPDALRLRDAAGRAVLGFRRAAAGAGDELYRSFEDIFRGPEEMIRDRQRVYLEVVRDRAPVVDVGCGRGEFLDLLAAAGIQAVGVDLDAAMVEACRAKGHDAHHGDGIAYLASQPDESLGAVFSAQLIEHLTWEELLEFHRVALAKLRPGGVFVAETVNPHSVPALKTFWVDITHRTPVFPEVAAALSRSIGFGSGWVLFPGGTGDLDTDLARQGDYAIVATKAGDGAIPTGQLDERAAAVLDAQAAATSGIPLHASARSTHPEPVLPGTGPALEAFERKVHSQHGEDGVIEKLFADVGTGSRYFVEFGVEDGTECNTRLLREQGWSGLTMDADHEDPDSGLARAFVTAANVNELFAHHQVPFDLDLLSIDVDSQDFYIWYALDAAYRPRVVVVEYNAAWGPDQDKVVLPNPEARWDGTVYHGASILALARLGWSKGYSLVYAERSGVNLFFVRADLAERLQTSSPRDDVAAIYRPPGFGEGGHPADPHDRPWTWSGHAMGG